VRAWRGERLDRATRAVPASEASTA
jgi:hypothetical protein